MSQQSPPLCHYCRTAVATTSDHIVPRARGGADAQYNRVPACRPCNQAKGDSMPTCACLTCRAAVNLPRRSGKRSRPKKRQMAASELANVSAFLRYPSAPGEK